MTLFIVDLKLADVVMYESAESDITLTNDQYIVRVEYAMPIDDYGLDFVPNIKGKKDGVVDVGADYYIGLG